MRYPWQHQQWQQLWQSIQSDRLPHALLLSGMAGVGKLDFARHIAQVLLCTQRSSDGDPCQTCHACRCVVTQAHPNLYQVTPETEGHAIKVDQIRALSEFIQQSSLQGEFRIALIYPAHNMNINAANALLKTLEEPSSGAIIILISDQAGALPATVRSRCQRILFATPERSAALQWLSGQWKQAGMSPEQSLRLAHGAPLAALALSQDDAAPMRDELFQGLQHAAERRADPLALAAKWQKTDPVKWMDLTLSCVSDLIRMQLGARSEQLTNQDYVSVLRAISSKIALSANLRLMTQLMTARAKMSAGVNYNKQLLIEAMLLKWLEPQT